MDYYRNSRINYHAFFADALGRLRSELRYCVFADLERIAGRFPHAIWHSSTGPHPIVIWCSNDYLGMGQHPKVIGAMVETATRTGTGAGGTRNIAGNNHPLVELERELVLALGARAASKSRRPNQGGADRGAAAGDDQPDAYCAGLCRRTRALQGGKRPATRRAEAPHAAQAAQAAEGRMVSKGRCPPLAARRFSTLWSAQEIGPCVVRDVNE